MKHSINCYYRGEDVPKFAVFVYEDPYRMLIPILSKSPLIDIVIFILDQNDIKVISLNEPLETGEFSSLIEVFNRTEPPMVEMIGFNVRVIFKDAKKKKIKKELN